MRRDEAQNICEQWKDLEEKAIHIRKIVKQHQSLSFPLVDTEETVDYAEYDTDHGVLLNTRSFFCGMTYSSSCVIPFHWFELSDEALVELVQNYTEFKERQKEEQDKIRKEADDALAKEERRKQWEELKKEFGE